MHTPSFYFERLYPLQDQILQGMLALETGFYLTGGTAASRGYLNHRFSDDLDFFVNDEARFGLWADRLIHGLSSRENWAVQVILREERFVRMEIRARDISMKIELVNDVPSHVGEVLEHEVLGRLESAENILANKITAVIDRNEPKDLADIWGFCCRRRCSLSSAIEGAQSKAAGIFHADLARVLCSATRDDWELVRWIGAPRLEQYLSDLVRLGESLILQNRAFKKRTETQILKGWHQVSRVPRPEAREGDLGRLRALNRLSFIACGSQRCARATIQRVPRKSTTIACAGRASRQLRPDSGINPSDQDAGWRVPGAPEPLL